MKIKKQIELFKKEFTHRDIIYLSIIGVTLLSLVVLNIDTKNNQDDRCWDMIKKMANSEGI